MDKVGCPMIWIGVGGKAIQAIIGEGVDGNAYACVPFCATLSVFAIVEKVGSVFNVVALQGLFVKKT